MVSAQSHLLHPKYRPDIDGLRAIAVLSVVGYHAAPGYVPGGFVGVDIFFVISGFLISTIIFGNFEKDNFSYLEFYARRIKRIFPALLIVLLSTMLFGWYVLFSDEFSQLGKHVAAGAGFLSNVVLWSEAGYFDTAAETKPLLHLWSLGVEEQFYILWPLLLGILWKRKFNFLLATLLVAIVSFAINIYWVERDPAASFFLPFSRIWELMVGGILAYIVLHRPHYLSRNSALLSLMSLLGLVLIGASIFLVTKHTKFPGWWALLPTMGAFLVIAGGPVVSVNRYLLGSRPAVWVGVISYPLYLWHWPLLSYAQIIHGDTPDRSIRFIAVVLSFLLAWGTYVLVEKRFKKGYSKAAIVFLSLSMGFFLVIGLLVWKGVPPPRHNSEFIERVVTAASDWDYPGKLKPTTVDGSRLYEKQGSNTKTLFIGDSHVEQYAPRIVQLLDNNPGYNTAVFATSSGCPPISHVYERTRILCSSARATAFEYANRQDVETVVIGANWNAYFLMETREDTGKMQNAMHYYYQDDGLKKQMFRGGNGASLAMQELEGIVARIAKNKRVYLLLDNPFGGNFSPKSFFKGSRLTQIHETAALKRNARAPYSPEQQQLREKLRSMAHRTGARVIDPAAYLCNEQGCMVTSENGKPIYKDASHLRPFFVKLQAEYIDISLQ